MTSDEIRETLAFLEREVAGLTGTRPPEPGEDRSYWEWQVLHAFTQVSKLDREFPVEVPDEIRPRLLAVAQGLLPLIAQYKDDQ